MSENTEQLLTSEDNKKVADKATNYTLSMPYSSPLEKPIVGLEQMDLPSNNMKDISDTLKKLTDKDMLKGEADQDWFNVLNNSFSAGIMDDGLSTNLSRPNASFKQSIPSANGELRAGIPKFKSAPGTAYTGQAARIRIKASLGLGTAFTVPLWHSGFWLTLKTPSEGDLLDLYRQISSEKVVLGRNTTGLIFTNSSSYTSKALIDFAVDNLYSTSLDLADNANIRNHIDIRDLPIIIWGMACATWPKGFQYRRPCVIDPDNCKHVITELIDLSKIQFTDNSRLTELQIVHMSNRAPASMSVDSLITYKKQFLNGIDTKVKLTDSGSIVLKTPTVQEHIDAGYKWVSAIESKYGQVMTESNEDRETHLFKHARATAMRQYSHNVKSIEIGDDVYDDRETIDDALDDMSGDDKIREKFLETVATYIDDSMVSIIAIPTYECPSCKKQQVPSKNIGMFSGLIAIDVAQTFFTLLVQKLRKIDNR